MRYADRLRMFNRAGIRFEGPAKLQRLQRDLLLQLESSNIPAKRYSGFEHCGIEACGRSVCSEVCFFGALHTRIRQIPAVLKLLKDNGPVCEVRILRDQWNRQVGSLSKAGVAAAKQLNRRGLDNVFNPDLIAVGLFKPTLELGAPDYFGWICEIHQLVAGATKEELEEAFRTRNVYSGSVWVREVDDLAAAVTRLFRLEIRAWNPVGDTYPTSRLYPQYRAELYLWLMELGQDDRIVRYGCDRHFHKLTKKPHIIRPKKSRKRGLQRERFDLTQWQERQNPNSPSRVSKQRPAPRYRVEKVSDPEYYTGQLRGSVSKRGY
jgi:hypothetical protein